MISGHVGSCAQAVLCTAFLSRLHGWNSDETRNQAFFLRTAVGCKHHARRHRVNEVLQPIVLLLVVPHWVLPLVGSPLLHRGIMTYFGLDA